MVFSSCISEGFLFRKIKEKRACQQGEQKHKLYKLRYFPLKQNPGKRSTSHSFFGNFTCFLFLYQSTRNFSSLTAREISPETLNRYINKGNRIWEHNFSFFRLNRQNPGNFPHLTDLFEISNGLFFTILFTKKKKSMKIRQENREA